MNYNSTSWAEGQGRAQPMCRERKTHWGSSVASTHRRPSLHDICRRERDLANLFQCESVVLAPFTASGSMHTHRSESNRTRRSGFCPCETLFGAYFCSTIIRAPNVAQRRIWGSISILRGVVFFSNRFYKRKWEPFWSAQRPKRNRREVNTLLTPRPD